MLNNIAGKIDLLNEVLIGFKTNRKILVIESDDWGCKRTQDELWNKQNSTYSKCPYDVFDALETPDDLYALFDVLNSLKDKEGNPAMITANTIMANPDYERIKDSNFEQYFYRPIYVDLRIDPKRKELPAIVKEAINSKVYFPQLHGREHVNIAQWLGALRRGHSELRKAFERKSFGINLKDKVNKRSNVMAALDFSNELELAEHYDSIKTGQSLFIDFFGFKSDTFIAPAYIWHPSHETAMKDASIMATQGIPYQYIPKPGSDEFEKKLRISGSVSTNSLISLVRNVHFEPSLIKRSDEVGNCLKRIKLAFFLGKPAVISAHRINFMGGNHEANRKDNLVLLKNLLHRVVNLWPDIEFMNSSQLYHIMTKKIAKLNNF